MRSRVMLLMMMLSGIVSQTISSPAAEEARLAVSTATAPPGGTARVEVTMSDASHVGALDLALHYDPNVVRFLRIEAGPIASNALLEANEIQPGRLLVALVASDGLAADGLLLQIEFKITGSEGEGTTLAVEAARAYHYEELIDLPLATADGEIRVVSAGLLPWHLIGGAAVFLLLLFIVVALLRRSRRKT